jgi:hypothetical protein
MKKSPLSPQNLGGVINKESSSDESEQEQQPIPLQEVKKDKPKRNYVMTDARKQAFEKAKQKRAENIALRKQLKEKETAEFEKR